MANEFETTGSSHPPDDDSPPEVLLDAYLFTSREEMERVYSTIGVTLRADDLSESGDKSNHTKMLWEVVNAATETVNSYTLKYYNPSALVNSPWIRRRATIIACYYLSMRRANGTQFTREFQLIIAELEKFLGPKPPLIPGPDGNPVPVRTSMIPTVSSYIIDDRLRYEKLRVRQQYSTKPYPGQKGYAQPLARDYV